MIKRSIHSPQSVYTLYNITSKYIKPTLTDLKGKTEKFTTTVGDYNKPLSIAD